MKLPVYCPFCGRAFAEHQWASLALHGFAGAVKSGGTWRAVELRVCPCAQVFGLEVELPMATGMPTRPLAAKASG